MSAYKSDFLQVLAERGFIHQVLDAAGLDARAAAGPITAYVGFDATAPSLHIGNLLSIMMLRWLQKTGQKPIALMGGGTSKIGDPSGKDTTRSMLSNEQIDANIASIRTVFSRFLDFNAGASMANNADWLDQLLYIPLLREVGRHFTINRMLTFDSVKLRLEREQPMTFLEFNYMILQAYDFVELFRRVSCRLQMGGSDQWGNIVNGVELGRRVDGTQLFGVTTPLITTADGAKMGKTEKGAVWLNAEQLSPYDYWQFWRNAQDSDVGRFLRLFTDLPLDEVARLEALEGAEINAAKKILADEATALAHGKEAAAAGAETARKTFEEGAAGESLPTAKIDGRILLSDALVRLGLVASKNEARRLIAQGGAKVDGETASEDMTLVVDCEVRLSAGKKKHGILVP